MTIEIEGVVVTEADIGKVVTYFGPPKEKGTISSFTDDKIWVKFNSNSGELCSSFRLKWGDYTKKQENED